MVRKPSTGESHVVKANTGLNNHIICQIIPNQASLILKSEISVKCFQETQEAPHVVGLMMGMWIITALLDKAAGMVMLLTRQPGTSSVAQFLPRTHNLIMLKEVSSL